MFIGEVIGTVVATRKTENTQGWSLRVVRRVTTDLAPTESYVVAVDVLGASIGELVLVTVGSAARQSQLTEARPCDAVIMAIVDTWQVEGKVKYTK
jgi:microcompartment protein CcmK/EutM